MNNFCLAFSMHIYSSTISLSLNYVILVILLLIDLVSFFFWEKKNIASPFSSRSFSFENRNWHEVNSNTWAVFNCYFHFSKLNVFLFLIFLDCVQSRRWINFLLTLSIVLSFKMIAKVTDDFFCFVFIVQLKKSELSGYQFHGQMRFTHY